MREPENSAHFFDDDMHESFQIRVANDGTVRFMRATEVGTLIGVGVSRKNLLPVIAYLLHLLTEEEAEGSHRGGRVTDIFPILFAWPFYIYLRAYGDGFPTDTQQAVHMTAAITFTALWMWMWTVAVFTTPSLLP